MILHPSGVKKTNYSIKNTEVTAIVQQNLGGDTEKCPSPL